MREQISKSTNVPEFSSDIAFVFRVDGRFFVKFNRSGAAVFAWSLAGATLFGSWDNESVLESRNRLAAKGYAPLLVMLDGGAL